MKRLFLLLLVLPLLIKAQRVELLISDKETQEPLAYANAYFKNSGIGGSSNFEGRAFFRSSDLLDTDSIVVSYIGYERLVTPFSKQNRKGRIEIKLKATSEHLPEVMVTYVKPPKPKRIIRQAIKNVTANYSTEPVMYTSFYRETLEENEMFIQLNEAIVKTHYTSYPQKRLNRKIWKDWYYDESYAFELDGDRYFSPLLKDFNTKEDQQTVVASRHSDNWSAYGIQTTLIGDPLLLFAFDKIKYQYDFFNPSLLGKYSFEHEPSEMINGEACYVISFYPESLDGRFIIDQGRKNKSAIYIGRMYISKESNALLKFEYKLAVERDFGFFEKRMPLDYRVEMNYKNIDGTYHIANIGFMETRKVGKTQDGKAILHTALRELSVLDVEMENVRPIPQDEQFKSTRFSSIRTYRDQYNPGFWESNEWTDSLKLDAKLRADLEASETLEYQFNDNIQEQSKDLPEPKAAKYAFYFDYHNTQVVDSLHWMALPAFEEDFKHYLSEENRYAKNFWLDDRAYQKRLFEELNTFYPKNADDSMTAKPGTYFIDEDSLGNVIFRYRVDSSESIEVLDLSHFESQHKEHFIKRLLPDQTKTHILAVTEKAGTLGNFAFVLPFGENTVVDSITDVYTIEWYSEGAVLYSKTNDLGSARTLQFRSIRNATDTTLYSEGDARFDVEVRKVGNRLVCAVQSKTENELRLIEQDVSPPTMKMIHQRKDGVLVDVKIDDGIYVLVNDELGGSSVRCATLQNPDELRQYATAQKEDYITDFLPVSNGVVALVYENSIPLLKFTEDGAKKWKTLDINLGLGDYHLLETDLTSDSIAFSFSSPSQPYSKYSFQLNTSVLKRLSDPTSVDPGYHRFTAVKRLWAKGYDKTKIPITVVRSAQSKKSDAGLILKVYGAYGAMTIPPYSAQDAILLNHGYTIAYAHVRGESILGPKWYKAGRELQKMNSIMDYLACAEFLIDKGYTTSEKLNGYGNSAGGLVVGQAINLKPELFNTVILDHPYLDVLNTMMNDTLPLTIDEYKEWGNPEQKETYDYILSYSPYQNIRQQEYPNVLLIASYKDYQTPVWQVAKYASKLREHNLADSEVLLLTDMKSGHIGNTTGKEWIKLFAETYSFVKMKNEKPVPNKTYKQ